MEPTSPASKALHKGDVLLSFDGVDIASDGTVPFRSGERISFSYLVSLKFTGDQVKRVPIASYHPDNIMSMYPKEAPVPHTSHPVDILSAMQLILRLWTLDVVDVGASEETALLYTPFWMNVWCIKVAVKVFAGKRSPIN